MVIGLMNRLEKRKRMWPVVASVILLATMAYANMQRAKPEDSDPYHAQVAEVAHNLPARFGAWVSETRPPMREAIEILQPNVMINRVYRNVDTGNTATVLLVHCRNARDLAGHYPPICYPAHGWSPTDSRAKDWRVGDLTVRGTEYRFSFDRIDGTTEIVICNFMMLPGGRLERDMDGIRKAAADYTRRFYGAGQIQILLSAELPEADRDEIIRQMLQANQPIIEVIGQEPKQ